MLTKILSFVKHRSSDIILVIIVALLVLLSFAAGYIIAKYQGKTPIRVEQQS